MNHRTNEPLIAVLVSMFLFGLFNYFVPSADGSKSSTADAPVQEPRR